MNLMSNQLTSASDGCNRETGEGQEHAGSKAFPGRNHRRLSGSQDKTCMVNAALRETQIGSWLWKLTTRWSTCHSV